MYNESLGGRSGVAKPPAVSLIPLLAACLLVTASTVTSAAEVKGEIVAAPELNPDFQGRPSPVHLILFQLAAADVFENADFFSLYDPEAAVLGGDLIGRSRMFVQPGETRPFEDEFDDEARYIGVIAAFTDIENAQWRSVVELPDKGLIRRAFSRDRFLIELGALDVSVTID